MRKLIVLWIALAGVQAFAGHAPLTPPHNPLDEDAIVTMACGKPLHDCLSSGNGSFDTRDLGYRYARVILRCRPSSPRTIGSRYSNASDSSDTAFGSTRITVCLETFVKSDLWATAQLKDQLADSSAGSIVTFTEPILGGLFVLIIVIIMVARNHAWERGAMLLCTNCKIVAKPQRRKDGRWYCRHCGADDPVPLDSPVAQSIFAGAHSNNPQDPRASIEME